MSRYLVLWLSFVFAAGTAVGQEAEPVDESPAVQEAAQSEVADALEDDAEASESVANTDAVSGAPKTLAGMSILGNEEAPKSLVIVPWKSSEIGDGLGVTDAIDDRARPVDKEVFLREVHYYELRSGTGD